MNLYNTLNEDEKSVLKESTEENKADSCFFSNNFVNNQCKNEKKKNGGICSPENIPWPLKCSERVIFACTSIPYKCFFNPQNGEWKFRPRRGESSLFASISWLSRETGWETKLVGWTGEITASCQEIQSNSNDMDTTNNTNTVLLTSEDKERFMESFSKSYEDEIVPIWMLSDSDHQFGETIEQQSRWRKYPNTVLLPLFHYRLWNNTTDEWNEQTCWKDYVEFNKAYSDAIVKIYRPADIIIIHDYYLLLLPQLIRQELPNAYLGFFLHEPFPSSEIFRCLPKRKEILMGMLGANMIGFQSYSFSRHFVSTCTRVLGFDSIGKGIDVNGAYVAIEVLPMGIDAQRVEKESQTQKIQKKMQFIRELYSNKKILIGRAKIYEIQGVLQGLKAFESFLKQFSNWRNQVVFIQVTSPVNDDTSKFEKQIQDLIAEINGTYGSLEFTPVHHYHQHLEKDEYFALLRSGDVGIITAIRDSINTTSLEYVICQKGNNGPLLLSEFSGTKDALQDAIQVNPWDVTDTAKKINEALCISESEKEARQLKLYNYVTMNTVQTWISSFISKLLTNLATFNYNQITPVIDTTLLTNAYQKANKRLFMFDYDGTLTPIVKDPLVAIPSQQLLRVLRALAENPQNQVWIISGRDQSFLSKWLDNIPQLGLSAEHGCYMRFPNTSNWLDLTKNMDVSWQEEVYKIFEYYTERTQGSFIEQKRCTLTWHYRRADPDYGLFQALECQNHLESLITSNYNVEVLNGKANIEVRPFSINKGEVVNQLLALFKDEKPDFVFSAGDDKTDEDMFRILKKREDLKTYFTVTIGASNKITTADWHIQGPFEVLSVLESLINIKSSNDSANDT
ncbi:trehalose-phosphatase [Pneumocystis carinii B80]|uniref:Trehalose-phosphatase n=1 Tax=Pneumocystis carinii (strain B80) TaxID=1408658 RepID=A0A0W4ZH40_PNEC8|nr:trehalose-phosphatase [Pneumocystis carinii B80]KTW27698.1 trehalose-phosphatase [Pneumocystis carinii B80]